MEGWSEGRVTHRDEWDEGLVTLHIVADTQPFRAGQFFNLGLYVGDDFLRRSYSAASAPGRHLEFFVTRVDDGHLTPPLVELPVGAGVYVERRPLGFFTLDRVPSGQDLWLVATGTGLGPFIAMLRTGEPWERFERVVLVHGVRLGRHLAYSPELERMTLSRAGRFVRVPVVSRERAVSGALHGRVTSALADGRLEQFAAVELSPARSHVMLCGNPAMIEEIVPLLAARGLRRHRAREPGHVSFEKYW